MTDFAKVAEFERRMAEYTGATYAVAVDSCTSAIFLCCKLLQADLVLMPARTYISVPAAVIHSGGRVEFEDVAWSGAYQLKPYPIYDSALRLTKGGYGGGFVCLSFQAKKHLPIGKGGMILLDDAPAARWLTRMRSNGRNFAVPYSEDSIEELGWNMHMMPEQAERGIGLISRLKHDAPDIEQPYPDLREMPVFKREIPSIIRRFHKEAA